MIEELKQIGLTEYESKVYLTLLKYGTLIGTEVHKKSGVPHSPTYHSLISLQEKGFVTISPLKPKKFSAIKPELAINNYINNKIGSIREVEKVIHRELEEMRDSKRGQDKMVEKVSIYAGFDNVFPLIKNLMDESKKTMRCMYTYEVRNYLQQKGTIDAINRGVKVRIIATLITGEGKKWIKEDIKLGAEVRYFNVEELRVFVQDKERSLISMINPRDRRDRVITFFDNGDFSKVLANYFDEIWEKAKKVS